MGCNSFLCSSSSPAAATDAHWGMNRAAVTANCSFSSSPWAHSSPHLVVLTTSALNMEELICTFCRQHPFLFIFLLVSPPLSFFQTGLCCQALSERWGCHEWWMTINLLLSSTTLLGDLQARWLPGMKTNLSFSFFPPILHPYLPRSFNLASRISTSSLLPKKLL